MGELGATVAIETLPGHVLTSLLASAVPSVVAMSLDDGDFTVVARRAANTLQAR